MTVLRHWILGNKGLWVHEGQETNQVSPLIAQFATLRKFLGVVEKGTPQADPG